MLQDFQIVHRLKPALFADSATAPVWATCLRSLAFGIHPEVCTDSDETYSNSEAYRFLLEVVCGLKSPILGETEVFGQFKQFSQEWVKQQPQRAALIQKILADAKNVRSQYLLDLGVQSYGSWIRHSLQPKRVHFIGAGQMVREITPYLAKKGCEISVHVRDPRKYSELGALALSECRFDFGAVIVAAPVSASEIQHWLGGHIPEQVIDLRDNSSIDALPFTNGLSRLADIFAEIEKTKQALQPRLEAAQSAIEECSRRASALGIVRPQGWDDLCA